MDEKKAIMLVIFVCILGRLLIAPYPFDEKIMAGGDAPAHIHLIDMFKTYGLAGWDPFWFGGEPMMKFYPPMAYAISSIFPLDAVMAFKLTFLLFFLAAPIAFYLFVKELKLSVKEILASTLIFSFTMNFNYLFDMGTFPSMVALPIGLFFLKYFVKTLKTDDYRYITPAAILLGVTVLTHSIIGAMFILFAIIYFAVNYCQKKSKNSLRNSLAILLLGGLISSFWVLPFITENRYSSFGWGQDDWLAAVPLAAVYRLFGFYINGLSTIVAGLAIILALTGFIAFARKKDADSRFIVWTAVVVTVLYTILGLSRSVLPLDRVVIFFSIPFSILVAKNISLRNLKYVVAAFIVIQVAYFVLTPVNASNDYLKYEKAFELMDQSGRLTFQPEVNSPLLFMAAQHGFENDAGEYDFSLTQKRFDFTRNKTLFECIEKQPVSERLFSFDGAFSRKSLVVEKSCELVNSGYLDYFRLQNVRYVIADKELGVLEVFDNDPSLDKIRDFGDFVLYQVKDIVYIKAPTLSSVERLDVGTIKIGLMDHSSAIIPIRISETWYPFWAANDSTIELKSDENGFISFDLHGIDGTKSVLLEYKEPDYYAWLWLLSGSGLIASVVPLVYRRLELYFESQL